MEKVKVIGAGLAGCEAAWQLAQRGIPVELYEMKPQKMTPAHHSSDFAELVCSNSLRSDQLENAVGLLKDCLLYTSGEGGRDAPGGNAGGIHDRIGDLFAVCERIQNGLFVVGKFAGVLAEPDLPQSGGTARSRRCAQGAVRRD